MAGFKLFSRNKKTKTVNYLTLIPSPLIGHEINPDGLATILIPRFKSKFWGKYLMTKTTKKYIRLNLDEYGSSTWLFMDGKRTVGEICDLLVIQYGEKIQPVDQRVTKFLTDLFLNEFIALTESSF
ncbi:MAG: PqqD family protein [Bacteroidales bacterium]